MWLSRVISPTISTIVGLVALLGLLGIPPVATRISLAQNPKPSASPTPLKQEEQEVDQDDVVRVDTTEVLLPVTVRNGNGQIVSGLTRKDFRVFEDGAEQTLSDLSLRQVPVDVVLMVDTSSSVVDNLDDFRRAAEGFADHLADEDRVSLIQFDDRVRLLQDWTRSRVQFRRSLNRITPGMFTRFNDAIVLTAHEQFQRTNARRAIIILTDGIDSGRGNSYEAALRGALEAQATVYVVSNLDIERAKKQSALNRLVSSSDSVARFNQLQIDDLKLGLAALDASERTLQTLTNETGGRLYKPRSFDDLDRTYAEVADELRHQYALYYAPTNRARDGRFRRVHVEATQQGYRVSARAGYYLGK